MTKEIFIVLFIILGYIGETNALDEENKSEKSFSISDYDELPYEMEMCILRAYVAFLKFWENKPHLLVSKFYPKEKSQFIDLFKETLRCYENHSHSIREQEDDEQEFINQDINENIICFLLALIISITIIVYLQDIRTILDIVSVICFVGCVMSFLFWYSITRSMKHVPVL